MLKDIALQIVNGNINNTSATIYNVGNAKVMLEYVMHKILITFLYYNDFNINLTQLEDCQRCVLLLLWFTGIVYFIIYN
jgi:hypothetical protein